MGFYFILLHDAPLLSELAILLPVGGADAEQWLETLPVSLDVLIVHVDVVEIPLLLEDLFGRTCT